ncbi:hypothetical protein F5878DRAFT_601763 [Lentinula raphanica]|uniref:Uncharacterized protein n=1 Tax=Lentinula raphanica TaxID=153919 RepID=A0AA38UKC4_9AGAR|nr:hypothetical protein F5878DRAFT_601763 [Lentinula raphanica]
MPNTAYSNLLQHLHRAQPTLPLETIQSALAFHIANQSPLPTPLAATAITSPLFLTHPLNLSRLQVLSNSFRHALHLKYTLFSGPRQGFFERSNSTRLTEWTSSLMKGLQGGDSLLRLAAASGVLQGLDDLLLEAIKAKVEDEVVIAFAEVMDQEGVAREWESEFQQTAPLNNSIQDQVPSLSISLLTISLILAAQSLPLVAPSKLKALPLAALSQLLTSCIIETFNRGDFLRESPTSAMLRPHIASLSRLEAFVLSLSLDSRPREGLTAAQITFNHLRAMAERVAEQIPQLLATTISPPSTSTGPFFTLKTLLFSVIMISDSVLSSCIYVPPTHYRLSATSSLSSPASLSLTTILTLSHLSFVVSQFGGISSSGTSEEASFKELRKTTYLALDILASGSSDVPERLLDELMDSRSPSVASNQPLGFRVGQPETVARSLVEEIIVLAQTSFALSCVEQLVPVLGVKYIRGPVWTLVEPNLIRRRHLYSPPSGIPSSDSTAEQFLDQLRRETFESAHSVVLAILNANVATIDTSTYALETPGLNLGEDVARDDMTLSDFCVRLVPFYTHCLIQNSGPGELSTSQLRIAYASLIRSACNFVSSQPHENDDPSKFSLAWYSMDELLGAIRNLENDESHLEQKHRLRLTFVSCVSALPLALLGRFFEEVDRLDEERKGSSADAIDLVQQEHKRMELMETLFREISEVVGDREKEFVLRWWSSFVTKNSTSKAKL